MGITSSRDNASLINSWLEWRGEVLLLLCWLRELHRHRYKASVRLKVKSIVGLILLMVGLVAMGGRLEGLCQMEHSLEAITIHL